MLSLLFLAAIITMNILVGPRMFDKSVERIPKLQEGKTDHQIESWHYYSDITTVLVTVLPILITYAAISQRARCFYYMFVVFSINAFVFLLDLATHQPRPSWVNSEIKAEYCAGSYGFPSIHATISIAVLVAVWFDLKD